MCFNSQKNFRVTKRKMGRKNFQLSVKRPEEEGSLRNRYKEILQLSSYENHIT